jgi:hypothetical protein
MVKEMIEDHGSPGMIPLRVRSAQAASCNSAGSGILPKRLSARGEGFAA